MSEMVERVARAMQSSKAWPAVFQAGTARELTLAAIVAMREPTMKMLRANWNAIKIEGDRPRGASSRKRLNKLRWQAMIDAALKETDNVES